MKCDLQCSHQRQKPSEDTLEAETWSGMGNGPEHASAGHSQNSGGTTPKPQERGVSTYYQSLIDMRQAIDGEDEADYRGLRTMKMIEIEMLKHLQVWKCSKTSIPNLVIPD